MSDAILFDGFLEPFENWSKLPHTLISALPLVDSLAELKIVLYILRHTWGYKEYDAAKPITTDEFAHGRKKKDGSRIDNGIGMSEPSIRSGVKLAIKHGFIKVTTDKTDLARVEKSYQLNIQESEGVNLLPPEGKKFTTGGKKINPRSEKETTDKKQKKENTRKRSHPLFPMKFPSNVRAYTSENIETYNKEHLADMKALVLAWHGDMYPNGLTNIGIEDCRDYIEVHKEALRLNIPCNDYPTLAKYTQKKEHWLIEKGSRIPIKFMLKHVTDYKPAAAKTYSDPAMDLNIPQPTTPILLQSKQGEKS